MKESLAIACLILLTAAGCDKKEQPTPTPMPTPGSKETPVVKDSLASPRESASGAAAVTPPPTTQPSAR